jgi:cytochrome c oxidase subunit IV
MSDYHATVAPGEVDEGQAVDAALDERRAHPPDSVYVLIALGLAALTAIEVGIYYLKSNYTTIGVLLVLMACKFAIVVGYFMHLRFDSPLLRRLFVGGLITAVTVYTIALLMFGVFHF